MSDSYIQAVEKNIDAAGERTDEITRLREENARLREAVKAAYYEGWTDNSSREYALQEINNDWETSEACATIREGQDNE